MSLTRIAYVLNVFPKVSETFIANELAELRRRGVDLVILSLRAPQDGIRHGIVARAGLDRKVCYDHETFAQLLRSFRPQLLHAHFATQATEAAMTLAADFAVPFCFTAHGYDIYRRPPEDFGRRAAAASALITVSCANADYISRTFGVAPDQIRIIPCGIDTDRFRPAPAPLDPPYIVCVARLRPVKNIRLLLEACALLRDRGHRFRCAVVGEGTEREVLTAARSALGLDDIVEMPGEAEQDEVRTWWQRAAIAVLCSRSEGMPVSLMEAAACGVPAVATAVGGVPELVDDGVTGLVVPPDDARALADALECLLSDPSLRERMGQAARERALHLYSVVKQLDSLMSVWNGVLGYA